jgi:hypothetical protein
LGKFRNKECLLCQISKDLSDELAVLIWDGYNNMARLTQSRGTSPAILSGYLDLNFLINVIVSSFKKRKMLSSNLLL